MLYTICAPGIPTFAALQNRAVDKILNFANMISFRQLVCQFWLRVAKVEPILTNVGHILVKFQPIRCRSSPICEQYAYFCSTQFSEEVKYIVLFSLKKQNKIKYLICPCLSQP